MLEKLHIYQRQNIKKNTVSICAIAVNISHDLYRNFLQEAPVITSLNYSVMYTPKSRNTIEGPMAVTFCQYWQPVFPQIVSFEKKLVDGRHSFYGPGVLNEHGFGASVESVRILEDHCMRWVEVVLKSSELLYLLKGHR